MGQHPIVTFNFSLLRAACGQALAQDTLVLAETALRMPTLAIASLRKRFIHLPTIGGGRFAAGVSPSGIQRKHRLRNAQFFPSQDMVGFGIKTGVAVQAVQRQTPNGLSNDRSKFRRVIGGPRSDRSPRDQVRGVMHHGGQFGPRTIPFGALPTTQKMNTDIVVGQSRRVDAGTRSLVDQAAAAGLRTNLLQQAVKSPFFSSRASAFWRVVQWGTLVRRRVFRKSVKS